MFGKYIQHLAIVSLKYFFNLDSTLSAHMFLVLLVIGGLVKLFFSKAVQELHNGVITVKDDVANLTEDVRSLKEQWATSNVHELINNYTRTAKNSLFQK